MTTLTELAERYDALAAEDDAFAAAGLRADSPERAAMDGALLDIGLEIAVKAGAISRVQRDHIEAGGFLVRSDSPEPFEALVVDILRDKGGDH